jgi:uncharacterized membrane protein
MAQSSLARLSSVFAGALGFSGSALAGLVAIASPIPALDEFGLVSLAVAIASAGVWVLGKNRKK